MVAEEDRTALWKEDIDHPRDDESKRTEYEGESHVTRERSVDTMSRNLNELESVCRLGVRESIVSLYRVPWLAGNNVRGFDLPRRFD